MDPYKCPVCNSNLKSQDKKYELNTLMNLWKEINVHFSDKVIAELEAQTIYTELYTCPNCHLEAFFPILNGTPDFYRELQSKMKYYEEDKWDFHEALNDTIGTKSVIEIGCGPGNFLIKCIEKKIESYGTEYNIDAVKFAEGRGISILSSEELESKTGFFDAVFCFHVLEHVQDPKEFINHLIKLIRPGGKICISVPNQDGPIKFIDPCIMNMPPHHLTRWRLKTFKILAEKLNLKIKKVSYEPLLLINHNYYSSFWANHFFSGDIKISKILKKLFTNYSNRFFEKLMNKHGLKYFRFLKGQAIYVVFEK
jgi:2-polyprenyl-3-methyl-5-hydroxy-6-metoxy-1,4-benzoquinol methylase